MKKLKNILLLISCFAVFVLDFYLICRCIIEIYHDPFYLVYIILFIWTYPFIYKFNSKVSKKDERISRILQKTKEQYLKSDEKVELIDKTKDKLKYIEYYSISHFFSDLIDQLNTVIFFLCIQILVLFISPESGENIGIVYAYALFLGAVIMTCVAIWIIFKFKYKSIVFIGTEKNINNKIKDLIAKEILNNGK